MPSTTRLYNEEMCAPNQGRMCDLVSVGMRECLQMVFKCKSIDGTFYSVNQSGNSLCSANTKKDGKEEEDRWTHVQTAQERTYARKYVNRFEAEMR